MKKIIFILAAVCATVCCLGACSVNDSDSYDSLDEMMKMHYSGIDVSVTNTFDENTSLLSEYKISYSGESITVTYAVEKFSALDPDGPLSGFKTTMRGEAVIENGVIVSVGGDEVDLPVTVTSPGFRFKKDYFSNEKLTGVSFTADVKERCTSGFFGATLPCSNMKVKATFIEGFRDIRITYTSASGSEVKYKYTFTK